MRSNTLYSYDISQFLGADSFGVLLNTANQKYNEAIWRRYADWGMPTDDTEWVQGMKETPILVRASILGPDGNKPQRSTEGWNVYKGSVPEFGHSFSIDQDDFKMLRKRSKLEGTPFENLMVDSLIQNSSNMLGGIHNELAHMVLSALSTAEIHEASVDGGKYDFQFPLEDGHKLNVTTMWFNKDGSANEAADPVKDIVDMQKYLTDGLQLAVDHWKISKTLLDKLLAHPKVISACMARAEFRNVNTSLQGSLLLTQDEELAIIHGLNIWPFDVIDFKTRHEEDGKPQLDEPAFDPKVMVAANSQFKPFTIKCTNSIYRDRLKAGPTASTSLYSFVEDRIAVLSTWQERPIKNIVDFGLQAGPVFRNTHDLAILKVQADK